MISRHFVSALSSQLSFTAAQWQGVENGARLMLVVFPAQTRGACSASRSPRNFAMAPWITI